MTWSEQNTLMSLHLKQTSSYFSEAQPGGLSRKTKGNRILLPGKVLPRIQRHCLAPPPKMTIWQTGDGAAQGCSFHERQVWNVLKVLEQLTWILLSKRLENSRLVLFYKIINYLAVVPHSCPEKADVCTRKNHPQKFRHIDYDVNSYRQSFFPNCINAWNSIADANILDIFKSKLQN